LNIIVYVLVAIAPCAFWLWIIYKGDKYKPEPRWLVVRTFLFGMAVAIPVAFIESALYPGSVQGPLSLSTAAYVAFGVAGLVEETGKFFVVRVGIYNSPHFEEPSDGLVYSAAAALGFASLENVIYLVQFGIQTILIRGLFSNLAHVVFSGLWGYPLALTKLGILKPKWFTYLGLLAAIIAHGIFDFLFFTGTAFTWLVLPFFLGMVALFILMMRHANRHSVYVEHRPG